ncbi:MAG: CsbD family protein [Ktedonobacteraceae bacterium]
MSDDVNREKREDDVSPANSAAGDKAEGTLRETGGRVKESAGALTGNRKLEAEGQADQVAGVAQRKKGTLKDRIKSWIDRR